MGAGYVLKLSEKGVYFREEKKRGREKERREMNEQGAPHFSHTKTTRVGRANKVSSWWRLAGKQIARGPGGCALLVEFCAVPGPCSFSWSRLPLGIPPSRNWGLARVRLSPAALRIQWGKAGRALRAVVREALVITRPAACAADRLALRRWEGC